MLTPFSKKGKEWEPKGLALRHLLNLDIREHLDPWQLAPRVGLLVAEKEDVLRTLQSQTDVHLLNAGRDRWSGGVLPKPFPDGTRLCILNPLQNTKRNKITLMEEITHMHLGHTPTKLRLIAQGTSVRDYDKKQEEDAYGIGCAALLPWGPFFRALDQGKTVAELAEFYDVTEKLIEYRIKITGASNLYKARQRNKFSP